MSIIGYNIKRKGNNMKEFNDKEQVLQFMKLEKFRSKLKEGETIRKAKNYNELFDLFLKLEWIPNEDELSQLIIEKLINEKEFKKSINLKKEFILSINFKKIKREMEVLANDKTITDFNELKNIFMSKIEESLTEFESKLTNKNEKFNYLIPLKSMYKKLNNYDKRLEIMYRASKETEWVKETNDIVFNNICNKVSEEFSLARKEIDKISCLTVFVFEMNLSLEDKKNLIREKLETLKLKQEIKTLLLNRAYCVFEGSKNNDI